MSKECDNKLLVEFTKDLRNLYSMLSELEAMKADDGVLKEAQAAVQDLEGRISDLASHNEPETSDHARVSLPDMARKEQFGATVNEVIQAVLKIINNTLTLNDLIKGFDYETTSLMLYNIVQGYSQIPEVQIAYLEKMEHLQSEHKNPAEAGMCTLFVAKIIYDHIKGEIPVTLKFDEVLKSIAPHFLEIDFSNTLATNVDTFTLTKLKKTIDGAVNYFKQGELFEYVILLNTVMIPLYEFHKDYTALSNVYANQHYLYSNFAGLDRIYSKYYRVEFFGNDFKELHNTQWIYRSNDRLFDFTERLKNNYPKQSITIVDSTKSLDGLDVNKMYIQATAVTPCAGQGQTQQEGFYMYNTVSQFVLETPFVAGEEKVHTDDITKQCKRKIFLNVAETFPTLVTRQRIASTKVVELSPIENSIEEIDKRLRSIQKEIQFVKGSPLGSSNETERYHGLRMLLQGSLRLQVNAGAAQICQSFFGNPAVRKGVDQQKLKVLKEKLEKLLDVCDKGIEEEKKAKDSSEAFSAEMREGYKVLQQNFKSCFEK